jgi:hypothetical protein
VHRLVEDPIIAISSGSFTANTHDASILVTTHWLDEHGSILGIIPHRAGVIHFRWRCMPMINKIGDRSEMPASQGDKQGKHLRNAQHVVNMGQESL